MNFVWVPQCCLSHLFASFAQDKEEHVRTKEEVAAENRERRLCEMRDKLRAQQERRADVARRRKEEEATAPDALNESTG